MKSFLIILAILAFLAGVMIASSAKGALHEMEALVLFLISAVFISGAGIIGAVNAIRNKMLPQDDRIETSPNEEIPTQDG